MAPNRKNLRKDSNTIKAIVKRAIAAQWKPGAIEMAIIMTTQMEPASDWDTAMLTQSQNHRNRRFIRRKSTKGIMRTPWGPEQMALW